MEGGEGVQVGALKAVIADVIVGVGGGGVGAVVGGVEQSGLFVVIVIVVVIKGMVYVVVLT